MGRMTDATPDSFVGLAKVQTFIRDRNALRQAIASGDIEAIEAAWARFERWTDCLNPALVKPKP
jgi:hypothetical protein